MERYHVTKVVGEGSFGKAILCARITDGKACVIKQVDTSKLPSKARRDASKEARLLAKLSHPNIVGFWESFFHGPSRDVLCIVMDYADGGDLSSCLRRRNGRLLEEEVILDWFVQTTLALKHIHDRRILHRDLKTQNIFLTRSKVVKLGDFGIAKVLGSTVDLARTAIGTPYYMSPEICQEKRYNHKSDMWSLGCILYEMACLRHAFEGSNMRMLVMKICAQEPRPIPSRYSPGLRTLLGQLLKKDPHSRPSTGAVLRRALIKDKIGRFLSEAQIKEEFSNGVSPSRPSGSPAASRNNPLTAAPVAGGRPRPPTPAGASPGWPFVPRAASPPSDGGNVEQVVVGRAVAGGGGGARVVQAAEVAVGAGGDWREGAVDARRRGVAKGKRLEDRAVAKERAEIAAVALGIAKPSPRRGSSQDDPEQKFARRKDRAASDAKRAWERGEAARAALGIGKKISPRRPSRPAEVEPQAATDAASPGARHGGGRPDGSPPAMVGGGRGKVSPQPRRPMGGVVRTPGGAAAGGAKENGPVANGKGDGGGIDGGVGRYSDRAFQRVQNVRGVVAKGAAARGAEVQPRRSPELGRRAREEGGVVGVVVGTDEAARGREEASDLARRRRAARAVFGIGFGETREDEPSVPRADDKNVMLKVESPSQPRSASPSESGSGGSRAAVAVAAAAADDDDDDDADHSASSPGAEAQTTAPQKHVRAEEEGSADTPTGATNDASCPERKAAREENEIDQMKGVAPDGDAAEVEVMGGEVAPEKALLPALAEEKDVIGDRGSWEPRGDSITDALAAVAVQGDVVDQDDKGARDGGEERGIAAPPSFRIDLGLKDGWFRNLEAKMGAIKAQVEQIKSPPFSTPHQSGDRRHDQDSASRHDAVATNSCITSRRESSCDLKTPISVRPAEREEDASYDQQVEPLAREGDEGDGRDVRGGGQEPAVAGMGEVGSTRADNRFPLVSRRRSDEEPAGSTPAAPLRCNLQQSKLLAAAAAIETAAAAVAAIPTIPAEKRPPETHRTGSEVDLPVRENQSHAHRAGANGGGPLPTRRTRRGGVEECHIKEARGGASYARVAEASPLRAVKVVTTPAQRRRGGGRGGAGAARRKPSAPSRSEGKPSRHAAAMAAGLERYSENRPPRKPGKGVRTPANADPEGAKVGTPSTEERVKALRAVRDRERAELRALIAQKRKHVHTSSAMDIASTGGGNGNDEGTPAADTPGAGPAEAREWTTPSNNRATGSPALPRSTEPGAKVAASDPPPRRRVRTPQDATAAAGKGALNFDGKVGGRRSSDGGGSADVPMSLRQRMRNAGAFKGDSDLKAAAAVAVVERPGEVSSAEVSRRNLATRQHNLRAYIANVRRERRAKKADPTIAASDDNDDDVSIWTTPGSCPPAEALGHRDESEIESTPPPPPSAAAVIDDNNDGLVRGARRNIGLEFDQEDEVWSCAGGGGAECSVVDVGHMPEKGEERGASGEEEGGEGEREAKEDREDGLEDGQEVWESGSGGGRAMSQQGGGSRDVVVELSTLEEPVVTERHEAEDGQPEWKFVYEELIAQQGGNDGLLEQHTNPPHEEVVGGDSTLHAEASPVPTEGVFPNAGHDADRPSSSEADADRRSGGSCDDRCSSFGGASADGGEAGFPNEAHVGLATYDSQRASSAAGVDGRGGVGEDEYSRMLKQMQQEVQQLGDGASTDSSWGDSSADKEEGGSREQQSVAIGRQSPSNSITSSSSSSNNISSNTHVEKMEGEGVGGGKIAPSGDNPSGDGSGESSNSDNSNHDRVTGDGDNNTNSGAPQSEAKKSWVQGESEEERRDEFPPRAEEAFIFHRGSLSSALEYSGSGLMMGGGCEEGAPILDAGDICSKAAAPNENGRAVEELPAAAVATAGFSVIPGQAKASDAMAALGDDTSEDGALDEDHGLADDEHRDTTSELLRGVEILPTSSTRKGDCDPLRSCETAADGGGATTARLTTSHCTKTSDALVVESFCTARRDREGGDGDEKTAAGSGRLEAASGPPNER